MALRYKPRKSKNQRETNNEGLKVKGESLRNKVRKTKQNSIRTGKQRKTAVVLVVLGINRTTRGSGFRQNGHEVLTITPSSSLVQDVQFPAHPS